MLRVMEIMVLLINMFCSETTINAVHYQDNDDLSYFCVYNLILKYFLNRKCYDNSAGLNFRNNKSGGGPYGT